MSARRTLADTAAARQTTYRDNILLLADKVAQKGLMHGTIEDFTAEFERALSIVTAVVDEFFTGETTED